jgi:glycosyltransferase involved in cell wall biosynthesis
MNQKLLFPLVCLSHLRWDFVYQRPHHLLSRFAAEGPVYFFEEPIFSEEPTRLAVSPREDNLTVLVPKISYTDRDSRNVAHIQRAMLDDFIALREIKDFVLWFYTPMAMDFAAHLQPVATVFDCMDELSAFKNAPVALIENERRLLENADVVFTGGQSIFEAKQGRHANVHAFPSSIDVQHFNRARTINEEPGDQRGIPHPRIGFCGVIDERTDINLLAQVAELKPDWQFIMIGPIVKISEEDLPRAQNIHYLGGKSYQELPAYFSGWDVSMMPFALNDATRYISPTKTPEYLAAGLPVVSTAIRDVVRPYGDMGLVSIAGTAQEFVQACENALNDSMSERLRSADEFLSHNSWDKTFSEMKRLIREAVDNKPKAAMNTV